MRIALVLGTLAMAANSFAISKVVSYTSSGGADIIFNGSVFNFADGSAGRDIVVTNTTNFTAPGTAAIVGLLGNISGNYTVGAVTCLSGVCNAAVTGGGAFSLFDGTNSLAGTFSPTTITTNAGSGTLNIAGQVTLTGISYGGTNVGLQEMAAFPAGIMDVSWTATSGGLTLPQLVNGIQRTITSYSGSIALVPEPRMYSLLLAPAMAGLFFLARRRKQSSEEQQ